MTDTVVASLQRRPDRNVRLWLTTDSPAMSPVRPLCRQQRTFECRCPNSWRFRPLRPQERTFLVVSPKVRS